ncbi:MAG: magnesium transporter [Alphaproteobacteria bacterium]|jgi:magnesium transporter
MTDRDPRPEAGSDELYGVTGDQVAAMRAALDAQDLPLVEDLTLGLHTADLADLIEGLPTSERHLLIDIIGARLDPELLTFLEEPVRDDVLERLSTKHVAAAVTELDTDDALDVVASLDGPIQAEVLEQLEAADRATLEESLSLPEDSAGRLMEREFVALPSHWTVGEIIDHLRDEAEKGGGSLPDEFYDLFVIDNDGRPIGIVSLSRILRSRRPVRLEDLMDRDINAIPLATDQEDVANLFLQYDLASAPVVDEDGKLVGVITHDDIMDVIQDEAEEDIMLLAGVKEDDIFHATLKTSRSRLSWLVLSMISAFTASLVIWYFKATIEQIVALAILMPIVSALGGNAGTQTMTVAVRAIAMKDLHRGNAARIVGKEILVSALNGAVLASMVGGVAGLWFSSLGLGVIIAAALVITMLAAGGAGVVIPLALNRFGADPAVASGVFLITVTDVVGLSAFLGFAALYLL